MPWLQSLECLSLSAVRLSEGSLSEVSPVSEESELPLSLGWRTLSVSERP